MEKKVFDLRKVFGMIISYDKDQMLDSPEKPFTVETALYPGGASAIHIHPYQDEVYQVKEGQMELLLDGKWHIVKAGEEVTIPKGAVHAFRNTGTQRAVAINSHSPGLRFGAMLEETQQLINEGKLTGVSGFKNIIYLSLQMMKYNDVTVPVRPPLFLLKIMASIGRLLGFSLENKHTSLKPVAG
jgi:quercetin dioxygenase-like cupin family protein